VSRIESRGGLVQKTMAGSSAIARAIATRLIIPPLSSDGRFCAAPSSPTSRSFEIAIMSIRLEGSAVVLLQR